MFGNNIIYILFRTVLTLIELIDLAILVYIVCSWVAPMSRVRFALERFLQPVFAPFRPLAAWVSRRFHFPLDFTCLFAMLALDILSRVLTRLFYTVISFF